MRIPVLLAELDRRGADDVSCAAAECIRGLLGDVQRQEDVQHGDGQPILLYCHVVMSSCLL